ncbi:MAG: hypothetical protein ACX93T_00280 [Bacteroidota bacterium]
MNNDSTLNGRYLGTISSDFIKVAERLKEASYLIRKQKSYPYPIFPISKVPLSVGALFIEKGEIGNQWYYYAAYLDILIQWGLIAKEKAAAFQDSYKNPEDFCCLLVVDTDFTNFVYVPYPEDY